MPPVTRDPQAALGPVVPQAALEVLELLEELEGRVEQARQVVPGRLAPLAPLASLGLLGILVPLVQRAALDQPDRLAIRDIQVELHYIPVMPNYLVLFFMYLGEEFHWYINTIAVYGWLLFLIVS